MINDDQGGTRNPYKCMNVMNKDTIDEKIKERCKTCEKQCMQEDLDKSRSYRAEANLNGSRIYPGSLDQIESLDKKKERLDR